MSSVDKQLKDGLYGLVKTAAYWLSLLLIFKGWSMWFVAYAPTNDVILYTFFIQLAIMVVFSFVWYKIVMWIFK